MEKTTTEYDNFDLTMRKLITVPHEKIKAQLNAEKAGKKKRKAKKPSASGHVSNDKD